MKNEKIIANKTNKLRVVYREVQESTRNTYSLEKLLEDLVDLDRHISQVTKDVEHTLTD